MSFRNLWNNMKCKNIFIMGLLEGAESEQGIEKLFGEIMTQNFLNLVKGKDT